MRHFINSKSDRLNGQVLSWLLSLDATPRVLPIFPTDNRFGLVVAHLFHGGVLAEVLPHRQITNSVGTGIPLGRLYFQIPKDNLFAVCPSLTNQAFEPKLGE